MKEWRYNYPLSNLERGYDLYYHGAVRQLQVQKHQVSAYVNKEKVIFYLENDTVSQIYCSCGNSQCSHEVAVLIAYENRHRFHKQPYFSSEQLIHKLSFEQKNELLLKLFNENSDLKIYANHMLGVDFSGSYDRQLQLHQTLFQYSKDGIVFPLQLYVHSFLEREKDLEDINLYFQLLNRLKVFEKDKTIQLLLYQILDSISVYLKLFPQYQSEIFEFFLKDSENDIYIDFIFDHFRFEPYLSYKLDFINKSIKRIEAYNAWGKSYYLERYLVKKLQVLYDLKETDEMNNLLREYYSFPKIREFFILGALNNSDRETALELIEDSKKLDQSNHYLMIQYQNFLIDLYEVSDQNKYFQALKEQLFDLDVGAFDIYLKFKSICPKNKWRYYFTQLIQQPMNEIRLLDILLEEQEYDLLFQTILNSNNLYYLEKKKHLLEKCCPNKFDEVYSFLKFHHF